MKAAILVGLASLFLLACHAPFYDESDHDYSVCEFRPGQLVRSKVSGEVGQVIAMYVVPKHISDSEERWCYADVRFRGSQELTDSRVLSDDGPITVRPLQVVKWMRPYELEHVKE